MTNRDGETTGGATVGQNTSGAESPTHCETAAHSSRVLRWVGLAHGAMSLREPPALPAQRRSGRGRATTEDALGDIDDLLGAAGM